MYNPITAKLLQQTPQIDGVSSEDMPQYLSRVYAQIICMKTSCVNDELPFQDEELVESYRELENVSNTLLLYLMQEGDDEKSRAISFVSAEARSLMAQVKPSKAEMLSLNTIPDSILSTLLFIIGGYYAEAIEMADKMVSADNDIDGVINTSIKYLAQGKLSAIKPLVFPQEVSLEKFFDHAEYLLWREIYKGIQDTASFLLGDGPFSSNKYDIVMQLTNKNDALSGRVLLSGPYLLAWLLKKASQQLKNDSLISISAPKRVESGIWNSTIRRQVKHRPYLWTNHLEAVREGLLEPGVSSVVTFPTGAGKTTLTELKIISSVLTGRRVVYIVPTHALEQQVSKNIERLCKDVLPDIVIFNDDVLLVDDEEEQTIQIMTPEKCNTLLRVSPDRFQNVGLVIFDEFHIVDVANNRSLVSMLVLLDLIQLLPDVDCMLLSAMIQNGAEISRWISSITHRVCLNLNNLWKPTSQLQGCMVYKQEEINELTNKLVTAQTSTNRTTPPSQLLSQMIVSPQCFFSLSTIWSTMNVSDYLPINIGNSHIHLSAKKSKDGNWILSANYNDVALELAAKFATISLKTIIFVTGKSATSSLIKKSQSAVLEDKMPYIQTTYAREILSITQELGSWNASYISNCNVIAIHNSLLMPAERNLSESIFRDVNGVNIMVATSTIAQGINLPADVVLIAGSERFDQNANAMKPIHANEILNAVGRAGRAGLCSHGTAIVIPTYIMSLKEYTIEESWIKKIKEGIFAKGEHCLEVNDPLTQFIEHPDQLESDLGQRLLMQGERSIVQYRLNNSFYAYQKRVIKDDSLQARIDNIVGILAMGDDALKMDRIDRLSIICGVRREIIEDIGTWLVSRSVYSIVNSSIEDMIEIIFSWLINRPQYFFEIIVNKDHVSKMIKILTGDEGAVVNCDMVMKMSELLHLYMNGVPYTGLGDHFPGKVDKYLENVRYFVSIIVPEISYIAGIFMQVIKDALLSLDNTIVFPKDFVTLPSCIKEGVTSYDMLKYKFDKKLLRVECHIKYGERG